MGDFLKEHDIYVDSYINQLNLRFAPSQGLRTHHGGIEELAELQKEFKIFKKGRSFRTSVAVLNIGGAQGNDAKNRLYDYFDNLKNHDSNVAGQNGDVAVVNAILKNFAAKQPLPVLFKYHDMRAEKGNTRVLVTPKEKAVTYFPHDYLVISFPTMQSKGSKKAVAKDSSKPAKTAGAKKDAKKK
jgi:hypothetical protein